MKRAKHDVDKELTAAGTAGGQGRSGAGVEDSAVIGGIALLGLLLILALTALFGGC